MSSIEGILKAIWQLTAVVDESKGCRGMEEQCTKNLTAVSLLISRYGLDDQIHAMKEQYILCNENLPLDFKGKFVNETLALLIAFCYLFPNDPQNVTLGVKDEQAVKRALQSVSLLGIYPYLSSGVGVSLKARTKADVSIDLKSSLPLCSRNFVLYCYIKVLLDCSSNGTISPFIFSSTVRCDIIASLIQIVHCNKLYATNHSYISTANIAFCEDQLHVFMSRINLTVAIKDLLILQNPVVKGPKRFWNCFNNACGFLLSSILIKQDGLKSVVKAMFDKWEGKYLHVQYLKLKVPETM